MAQVAFYLTCFHVKQVEQNARVYRGRKRNVERRKTVAEEVTRPFALLCPL